MADLNLYTINLAENLDEDYFDNQHEIRSRLNPYLSYFNGIRRYHMENPVAQFEHRRCDQQTMMNISKNTQKHKTYGNTGIPDQNAVWITLGILTDEQVAKILKNEIENVYEHDPDEMIKRIKSKQNEIKIIRADEENNAIQLKRKPAKKMLTIFVNTYQIDMILKAINKLKNKPLPEYGPLLKLFYEDGRAVWPEFRSEPVNEWEFLSDGDRDGTAEQREFVEKALATPDYAFLEGPPGSGKTTALCELVLQLASRKKRVLFCASTHVAVDNLLEKLTDKNTRKKSENLIPIRIGDSPKVSERVRDYEYHRVAKLIKNDIQKGLAAQRTKSAAQNMLSDVLSHSDDEISRIARDCANLVCGTTIGILSNPDIRNGSFRRFDYMIIDEASKTTFQEFLVPALYADRWIIVGDTKQLSPYTDQDEISMHLESCATSDVKDVYLDVFLASKGRRSTAVATEDGELRQMYEKRCDKMNVKCYKADDRERHAGQGISKKQAMENPRRGKIILGSARNISRLALRDGWMIRDHSLSDPDQPAVKTALNKQAKKAKSDARTGKRMDRAKGYKKEAEITWGNEVAWRLVFGSKDLADLLPRKHVEYLDRKLANIKQITLPSILEVLQHGYDPGMPAGMEGSDDAENLPDCDGSDEDDAAKINSLPRDDFASRHTLLVWQHRMHPEIAAFSHRHVYDEKALHTPKILESERKWGYAEYGARLVWFDVKRDPADKGISNRAESSRIIKEIEKFYAYACDHKRPSSGPWEIAVLTFYREQESTLRRALRQLTGQNVMHSFCMPKDKPTVFIELRTVDSFQGHESDLVFLSLANDHSTIFLKNENRLNVAVTRARYQCVVVGDRISMQKKDSILSRLADIPVQIGVGST